MCRTIRKYTEKKDTIFPEHTLRKIQEQKTEK